jgi:P4 family phage/plasmid primase-like protien
MNIIGIKPGYQLGAKVGVNMSGPPIMGSIANASRFLSQYAIKRGDPVSKTTSVTGMNDEKINCGKYHIPKEEYEGFLSHIATFVYDERVPLGLVERPLNELEDGTRLSPIRIDLDLRFKAEAPFVDDSGKPVRQIDIKMIEAFVRCVWEELCKIVDFTDFEQEDATFYILQKPEPEMGEDSKKRKIVKDGVHIFCKGIQAIPELHLYLRHRVLKHMEKVFPSEFFNVIDKTGIYDETVLYKGGWMIHGNHKKGKKAYDVIFRSVFNTRDVTTPPTVLKTRTTTKDDNKQLVKTLSIRYGIEGSYVPNIQEDVRSEFAEFVKSNSITRQSLEINARRNHSDPIGAHQTSILHEEASMFGANTDHLPIVFSDSLQSAAWLVDMLSPRRATSYDTWIRVGICLRNMSRIEGLPDVRLGTTRKKMSDDSEIIVDNGLYNLWVEFSRKSGSYTEGEEDKNDWYNKFWIKFSSRNNSDGMIKRPTLRLWAKADSPDRYAKFQDRDIDAEIRRVLRGGGTHVDIARLARLMYGDEFICAHIKNSQWYHFDKSAHRFVKSDSATTLRRELSGRIRLKFSAFGLIIRQKLQARNERVKGIRAATDTLVNSSSVEVLAEEDDADNQDDSDVVVEPDKDERVKTCTKVFNSLGSTGFLDSVITECKHCFYETYGDEFLKRLDTNKNLIGFNNGVYDLENGMFREGRPEDMISLTCGYDYIPFDSTSPKVCFILDMFAKIFVNPEVREYMWAILGSCLLGENPRQEVYFLNGKGANGKSVIAQWMQVALGDYAIKPNVTLLTDNRGNAQAASPEVFALKSKRFVYMEEPDEGDNIKINNGLLKDYSGGGTVRARPLYGEPETFINMFKIFFSCNKFPKITSEDAMWRRLKVVEMRSKFLKPGTPIRDSKYEFYRNEELMSPEFIGRYVDAFMSILVDYYNRYWGVRKSDDPFIEPMEVLEFSTKKRLESEKTGGLIEHLYDYIPEPEILATYVGNRTEILKLPTIGKIVNHIMSKTKKRTVRKREAHGISQKEYLPDAEVVAAIQKEDGKGKKEKKDIAIAIETFFNIKNIRGLTIDDSDEVYYPIIEKPESDDELDDIPALV